MNAWKRGWCPLGGSARRFELDDVFVGMRDVEVLAHQLGSQVGIDVVGIEPRHEVLELVALRGQRRDPGFSLVEQSEGAKTT